MTRLLQFGCYLLIAYLAYACASTSLTRETKVLVFTKTEGFRHPSIPAGIEAIRQIGQNLKFKVDTTENAAAFNEKNLRQYSTVIFLNTTGDVLDYRQQAEFERYIQAGGGFVGVHAAADTEYDWPWYGKLVGAYFDSHPNEPNVRQASIQLIDQDHPATDFLPEVWPRNDEWYNYKEINPDLKILLNLDESTYEGGTNGDSHPIAWYQAYDGGRAFYTGLGHTEASYREDLFIKHLTGGIRYAIGQNQPLDYGKASSQVPPDEDRFTKTVLVENLNEPMEFELLPDGRVLIIERKGDIKLLNPEDQAIRTIHHLEVWHEYEDGLLGITLDPNFSDNRWVYLFYSPPGDLPKQHVSRFTFSNDQLDMASEQVILEIPVQRETCCHSAGSLEFGSDGNLFISVGDNTNPFASDGFAPIDEREGRASWDAQKSSANTNDLRGKILRIKPEADGSYSIPEGNLFPLGSQKGRPEIYVMGCRNPFRFSVDSRTKYLYWGDVGPDARDDQADRGSRGHDELNQAKKPGYFGWPYFIGDNQPYRDYDFQAKASGQPFDPVRPINNSPHNTGREILPPAQKAFIWYPYVQSDEFPLLRSGSRNAMAGPVYYYDDYAGDKKFPRYYDGKLIFYDWMRRWILMVTTNEEGDLEKIEPFAPHLTFNNPIDMMFSKDGVLYVLEYGTTWFEKNVDARLSRIEFKAGNRAPIAQIQADHLGGKVPLTVQFSAKNSTDPDGDSLTYEWKFTSSYEVQSRAPNPTFTFTKSGIYEPYLVVRDAQGEIASAQMTLHVGNALPEIDWNVVAANRSFYWETPLRYQVQVRDEEDGSLANGGIRPEEVLVNINYLPQGQDKTLIAQGHQAFLKQSQGMKLVEKYNCKSCHALEKNATGPAYREVAKRYQDDPSTRSRLVKRIQQGGTGNWGERVMPAHPQVTEAEAQTMVDYILSLDKEALPAQSLAWEGTFAPQGKKGGVFYLSATYTDRGAEGLPNYTHTEYLKLRPPRLEAEWNDFASPELRPRDIPQQEGKALTNCKHESYLIFKNLDLTGVKEFTCQFLALESYTGGGKIELRTGSPQGKKLGEMLVPKAEAQKLHQISTSLQTTEGFQDVYIVFKHPQKTEQNICAPDWFYLDNRVGKILE